MSTTLWIILAIIIVVVAVVAAIAAQAQRRQRLRSTFGPEYDRAVQAGSNRREAETELAGRIKRRKELEIRPLDPVARDRYVASWQAIQARFVDDPGGAVTDADALVNEVMSRRGYPMADFEQRAADISVDHAEEVDNYRRAHAVATSLSSGEVSTEDLRTAMIHYRSLFSSLLDVSERSAEAVR